MTNLTLYHFPGACSQVCIYALTQAGLPFDVALVDLQSAEQTSETYLKVSPLGKVPALRADDVVITENAAILTFVAATRPEAGLLPKASSPLDLARQQAGLSFCGGTLHPIVRGIANPARLTEGDVEPVRNTAIKLALKSFGYADRKIREGGWWLGEPSVIDVYLNWAVRTAARGGFDFSAFVGLDQLHQRLMERPAFADMVAREAEDTRKLAERRSAKTADAEASIVR